MSIGACDRTVLPLVIEGPSETSGKLDSGVPITDNQGPSLKGVDVKKPRENRGFDGVVHLSDAYKMTPTGCEQQQKTRAKMGLGGSGPLPVPSSLPITDPGANELMTIWMALDDRGRDDLVGVARGLAARRGEVV